MVQLTMVRIVCFILCDFCHNKKHLKKRIMDFSNIEMATVFRMLTQQLTGYIWLGYVFAVKVNGLQS